MRFGNVSSSLVLGWAALLAVGCATTSPDIEVPASEYTEAFTAARDVLHSYRFTLERVDARAGVITTQPRSSGGFLTPWNTLESTLGQEWEDTVHNQQRRVEIVFSPFLPPTPADAPSATTAASDSLEAPAEPVFKPNQAREHALDLIEAPRDTNAHVRVVLERIYQYGWRPNTRSSYLGSYTQNTQADVPSRVEVEISNDEQLAGRIAAEIRSTIMKRAQARANATPDAPENPPASPSTGP